MTDPPTEGAAADAQLSSEEYLDAQDRLVELMWADEGTPEAEERQRLIDRCRAFEREVLRKDIGACQSGENGDGAARLGSVRLEVQLPAHLRVRLHFKALVEGRAVGEIVQEAIKEALARAGGQQERSELNNDDARTSPSSPPPLRLLRPPNGCDRSGS